MPVRLRSLRSASWNFSPRFPALTLGKSPPIRSRRSPRFKFQSAHRPSGISHPSHISPLKQGRIAGILRSAKSCNPFQKFLKKRGMVRKGEKGAFFKKSLFPLPGTTLPSLSISAQLHFLPSLKEDLFGTAADRPDFRGVNGKTAFLQKKMEFL